MGLATQKFNLIELKSNAGKDYYLEGFISTSDPDSFNDIVTKNAQQVILNEILNKEITMDEDHDSHRNPKTGEAYGRILNKIPLAKIERAELREVGDSVVTWVRVKLNNDYPLFDKVLGSIKNGFLHSFSIAYKTIKENSVKVGNKIFNVIDDLKILNVGITGVPVNTNAKFQLALKSFIQMEDKIKLEELQSQFDTISKENVELKSSLEAKEVELKSLSEKVKLENAKEVELKSIAGEKEKEMAELKSQVSSFDEKVAGEMKTLKEEVVSLKSLIEKLRATPVNSAQMKSISQVEQTNVNASINFASLM